MAQPTDALYFREQYGRTLRRPERGKTHAFIVAPFQEGQTQQEQANLIKIVQHSLIRCIDHGEVHYVSAEMTGVLQNLVDRYLKDRTLFHIDQGDVPSLTGFVYFDGHIQLPTIYSPTGYQDLRAICWDQYAVSTPPNGGSARDWDGVSTASKPGLYFGGAETGIKQPTEVIGKIIYTVCDSPNQGQRQEYGPWKPRHWIPTQYGVRFGAEHINGTYGPAEFHDLLSPEDLAKDRADAVAAMLTVLRILTAWTRIIQTEIPVRRPAPKDYDRIMHKEGRPPADVQVTLLRRYSDTPPHGMAIVDWAYRWEVKGHYRWQRVGPGRAMLRRVWVKEYEKGPKDKPLVHRKRVTALVR